MRRRVDIRELPSAVSEPLKLASDLARGGHKKRHSMSEACENNASTSPAKYSFEVLYIHIMFLLSQRDSRIKDIYAP